MDKRIRSAITPSLKICPTPVPTQSLTSIMCLFGRLKLNLTFNFYEKYVNNAEILNSRGEGVWFYLLTFDVAPSDTFVSSLGLPLLKL
jgi:hypothetical protein